MIKRNINNSPGVWKTIIPSFINNDPINDQLIDELSHAKQEYITKKIIDKELINRAKEKIEYSVIPVFYDEKYTNFFYGRVIDDMIGRLKIKNNAQKR